MLAKRSARPSWRTLPRPRRPKWSARSSFLIGLGLAVVVTPLVLLTVHRSIWEELEILTAALAVLMFGYLAVVLYLGVRFDKAERCSIDWPISRPGEVLDCVDFGPSGEPGFFTEAGGELGPLGIIVGVLLDLCVWLVLACLIALVVWIGLNLGAAVVMAVLVPVFYFYRRSLRFVVVRGRHCRGKWSRSTLYAAGMTLAFTVWFYLLFFAGHRITTLANPSRRVGEDVADDGGRLVASPRRSALMLDLAEPANGGWNTHRRYGLRVRGESRRSG